MNNAEHTFDKDSRSYNLHRPTYPEEVYSFLSGLCIDKELTWDCACGNGQVARGLIKHFKKIEATDMSENQIEHAYKDKKITYSLQKSESTNFPDSCFDLICVAEAIHWFDIPAFFKEVTRTLKKGGIFAMWGYCNLKVGPDVNRILADTMIKPLVPYFSPKTKLLREKYETIEFPYGKIETPEFKMLVNWNLDQYIDYIRTWSAFKLYSENNPGEILLDQLAEKLSGIWKPEKTRAIDMDFFLHVGRNN